MIAADIPGRDLPPPGETFPGWELVAPMLRPRNASVFSLMDRPVVIWDEPDQVQSAVKRLWTRLEQIERSPAYDPDRVFFRWEELERQALGGPQVVFQQLDIGWSPYGPRDQHPHRHAARHELSRQHSGGGGRSPDIGGSRQQSGLLRFCYR